MFKDKGGHLLAASGSPAKVGRRRRPEKETSLSANCAWHDWADKDNDGDSDDDNSDGADDNSDCGDDDDNGGGEDDTFSYDQTNTA